MNKENCALKLVDKIILYCVTSQSTHGTTTEKNVINSL